jgi:hypothetical protein
VVTFWLHIFFDPPQGWRGSAKTRPLVLALRDYFVERVEHSKLPPVSKELVKKRPISSVPRPEPEEDDNDDDPETDISVPLPDSWVTAYLQVKRLRYLQRRSRLPSSLFTHSSIQRRWIQTPPDSQRYLRSMRLRMGVPRIGGNSPTRFTNHSMIYHPTLFQFPALDLVLVHRLADLRDKVLRRDRRAVCANDVAEIRDRDPDAGEQALCQ